MDREIDPVGGQLAQERRHRDVTAGIEERDRGRDARAVAIRARREREQDGHHPRRIRAARRADPCEGQGRIAERATIRDQVRRVAAVRLEAHHERGVDRTEPEDDPSEGRVISGPIGDEREEHDPGRHDEDTHPRQADLRLEHAADREHALRLDRLRCDR